MNGPASKRFALNCGVWAGVHLAASCLPQVLPDRLFQPEAWPWRVRGFEADGRIYDRVLRVRAWRGLLPDGGRLLGRGGHRALPARGDRETWDRLVVQIGRSELAHWLAVFCGPVFALFNPPLAVAQIQAYAIVTNLPCVIVQRYNRARLRKVSRWRQVRVKGAA